MGFIVWHTVAICFLACIWLSALKKAHKMHVFDRSVGAFTVYLWHGMFPMVWTVIVVLIAFAIG